MTVNASPPQSNDSAQAWFYRIKRQIQTATQCTELRFENISTDQGSLLVDSLSQDPDIERRNPRFSYNSFTKVLNVLIMPTNVHNVHQQWIHEENMRMALSGFLNAAEALGLKTGVGTTISDFTGQYTGSRKDPDFLIHYDSVLMPSIAIESGWTESLPRLHGDMCMWLVGGLPAVQVVIVLCWTKTTETPVHRVKGIFEVWERDAGNTPYLKQSGAIFPAPANAATQVIPISRAQLFGPAHVFPGRNGADVWNLSVDILRTWASAEIVNMGFQPA
ncbi:hypothetical protein DTO166G4_5149 [Paecilomyces variotii]|nr:hypothetical protein DTO166G4_5149 [Paecilomyces variotii]KAJ9229354.1 hypothetical protein DTO166G5_7936 [Paecilomyces variotii]KAJ9366682.1 hypothetical protein DTO282E5_8637 [Paecilomyces variotii]